MCQLKEKLGLLSIGTIRSNRTKGCPLPSDKLVMKQGRGTSLVQSTCNGQVAVLKWVDNKVVNMAGSWAGRSPQHIVKRWDKKAKKKIDVACPQIVRLYNKNMGGVDLFDMLMHLYKLPSRAKRWPVPLISFMIDLSLVNAFLLYRADQKVDNDVVESSKAFRLRVVEALVSSKPKKKVGRPTLEESSRTEEVPRNHTKKLPPDVLRLDQHNHFVVFQEKKGRCSHCSILGVNSTTFAKCSKCEVMLCVLRNRNCFFDFHSLEV